MASSSPVIMLVDLDSFYPSVEIRGDPSLIGKPLVVGGDPKKKRGIVVSASYEARRLGIHAGQPISRAYALSPEATYVRPNFPLYGEVSGRVMRVLKSRADKFEQVSIDEAFLDVSLRCGGDYDAAMSIAREIKDELKATESLSCSIGIAPNKSTAKIAADYQKPGGLTVVKPENVLAFLAPLDVSAITGVGKKTGDYLNSIGVKSIGDLQKLPGKDLVGRFGKTGVWLWGVAHGLEQIGVRERTVMKSLSQEHTFEKDVPTKIALEKIRELADKLHERVLKAGYEFRVVSIKVRFSHFQTFTRENTLPAFTDSRQAIRDEAANLMKEFFAGSEKRVRLVGVRVADLRKSEKENSGLDAFLSVPPSAPTSASRPS